jgi:hypothetical protein
MPNFSKVELKTIVSKIIFCIEDEIVCIYKNNNPRQLHFFSSQGEACACGCVCARVSGFKKFTTTKFITIRPVSKGVVRQLQTAPRVSSHP